LFWPVLAGFSWRRQRNAKIFARFAPLPFVIGKLVPVLPPAARLNSASLPPPPFAAAFCYRQACACFAACRKAKQCKPAAAAFCRRLLLSASLCLLCRLPQG
jgi:hypothetical protein